MDVGVESRDMAGGRQLRDLLNRHDDLREQEGRMGRPGCGSEGTIDLLLEFVYRVLYVPLVYIDVLLSCSAHA